MAEEKENLTPNPDQDGDKDNKNKKKRSNLAVRSFTAIFIAIMYVVPIVLSFFVHGLFYDVLVLFLTLMASYEFVRAVSARYAKPIEGVVYANIILGYAAFKLVYELVPKLRNSGATSMYFVSLTVCFIACVIIAMSGKKYNTDSVVSTLFVMIYPGTLMSYLMALNYLGANTHVAILLAFIVTTLTDTMAYFVGSSVKGPKLCPTISPKKTISGAVGGLLGGIGGGVIVYFLAKADVLGCNNIVTAFVPNLIHFLLLGFGAALFCQIGDLTSSYVKRACGIKDFGTILRGHGGFMDRVDGLIVSAAFIYIYFAVLGFVL